MSDSGQDIPITQQPIQFHPNAISPGPGELQQPLSGPQQYHMHGLPRPPSFPQQGYYMHEPSQQSIHQQQQMTTVVINQQPEETGNKLMVTSLHGQRDWTSGLFGCFDDMEICLCTFFCWECMEYKNFQRAGENPFLFCCCYPQTAVALRTKIRVMGDIKGSICNDWLAWSCCLACHTCQLAREMNAMGLA